MATTTTTTTTTTDARHAACDALAAEYGWFWTGCAPVEAVADALIALYEGQMDYYRPYIPRAIYETWSDYIYRHSRRPELRRTDDELLAIHNRVLAHFGREPLAPDCLHGKPLFLAAAA